MLDHFINSMPAPSVGTSWAVMMMAVWTASLAGSPHCVGMCGPLAAGVSRTLFQNIAYNLGRALAYMGLGAVFGASGQWLMEVSSPGLRYTATGLMVMLILAVSYRIAIDKPWHIPLPKWFLNFHRKLTTAIFRGDMTDNEKSFLAGLITVGLPCGWLYTFVGLAAATGSAVRGLSVLAAFWLGTLPIMTVVPTLAGRTLLALRGRAPRLVGALVASSALFVIWAKWAAVAAHASCH